MATPTTPQAVIGGEVAAARRLVSRLALVAVQGEQLQAMCDELRPMVQRIGEDPALLRSAELLACALEAVSGVARDIATVTDALGAGLQPARRGDRPPGGPA